MDINERIQCESEDFDCYKNDIWGISDAIYGIRKTNGLNCHHGMCPTK